MCVEDDVMVKCLECKGFKVFLYVENEEFVLIEVDLVV